MAEKDQHSHNTIIDDNVRSPNTTGKKKTRKCPFGISCHKPSCQLWHPKDRNLRDRGKKCADFDCAALHPPFRIGLCNNAALCHNANCKYLHPPSWNPCLGGLNCIQAECTKLHPPGRKVPESSGNGKLKHQKHGNPLSQAQRDERRLQAKLPILSAKDEFIKRLKEDKFVVVKAETGSGKTTQLPQYAAEAFQSTGGLVVCTQPRAIATISIAQRIAIEFDGSKVGNNVGYQIGRGKSAKGKQIMLMTDASLVNMAQMDPLLSAISVLIIDEAHERSLNTDIVLGIAKMIRSKRPDDFYVVVASATIDPKPFLDFFGSRAEISVAARKFKIDVSYDECDPDELLSFSTSSLLIDKVLSSLATHNIGNCLVFLPGSLDVDKAVKHFTRVAPAHLIALPLYGSLPPEEQLRVMEFNDHGGSKRMVVFCTNVAETSITVPNVRLVIDSGLAKEARYDPVRRITVLEQVYISNSSADQRAGRSGRVADGHCVRLFSPGFITRDRIQPEIFRSSLDKVVLALCAMRQDPRAFPLIDAPPVSDINQSIDTLLHLECLLPESLEITELGKLFTAVSFDPRLTSFVAYAERHFGLGSVAADIAAILSAPGSIFFFGGAENRDSTKQKWALVASKFSSDLFFQRAVLQSWLDSGSVDKATRMCSTCRKKQMEHGCRSCRVSYAFENGLNNKVLETVQSDSHHVMQALSSLHSSSSSIKYDENEAVGRSLAHAFPEQIAEFLLRSDPDAGAFLLASNMKGTLSSTSAVTQAAAKEMNHDRTSNLILTMSVTRLPSGRVILDQMHPIKLDWLPQKWHDYVLQTQKDIQLCFSRQNLHRRYRTLLVKELVKIGDSDFIVIVHDRKAASTLKAYAPSVVRDRVGQQIWTIVDSLVSKDLKESRTLEIGVSETKVTISAGAALESVHIGSEASHKLRIEYPPVSSTADLRAWIIRESGIQESSIVDALYKYDTRHLKDPIRYPCFGVLTFDHPDATRAVLSKLPKCSFGMDQDDNCKAVRWTLSEYLENAQQRAKLDGTTPAPFKCIKREATPTNYVLTIINILPSEINRLISIEKQLGVKRKRKMNERPVEFLSMSFTDPSKRDQAESIILTANPPIAVKPSARSIRLVKKEFPAKSRHLLIFKTTKDAEAWYQKAGTLQVSGEASVKVKFGHLFSHLPLLAERFSRDCDCQCRVVDNYKKERRGLDDVEDEEAEEDDDDPDKIKLVIFDGASPTKCGEAAKRLKKATASLRIIFSRRDQLAMLQELHPTGFLQSCSENLGLVLQEFWAQATGGDLIGFTLYGPGEAQGQFMNRLAQEAQKFQERYATIPLDTVAVALMNKNRHGIPKFQSLKEQLSRRGVTCSFLPIDGAIQILCAKGSTQALLEESKSIVAQFLLELGSEPLPEQCCSFCRSSGASPFTICGHFYCFDCLRATCLGFEHRNEGLKIVCPVRGCATPVHISDIMKSCRERDQTEIGRMALRCHIQSDPKYAAYALCLRESCGGLLMKSNGYSTCSECGAPQCPSCRIQDDFLHIDRTCKEFEDISAAAADFVLVRTIEKAKAFVTENWDMKDPIISTVQNAGLNRGCPAVQRYVRAIKRFKRGFRILDDESRSIFAWHGAPQPSVIASICHEGFDPGRRSAQVWGPGEYFGVRASVSKDYCGQSKHMILAQIICDASYVKRQKDFCYVVNNPLDWKWSFCLPLLVINFGDLEGNVKFIEADYVHIPGINQPPPKPISRPVPAPREVAPEPDSSSYYRSANNSNYHYGGSSSSNSHQSSNQSQYSSNRAPPPNRPQADWRPSQPAKQSDGCSIL